MARSRRIGNPASRRTPVRRQVTTGQRRLHVCAGRVAAWRARGTSLGSAIPLIGALQRTTRFQGAAVEAASTFARKHDGSMTRDEAPRGRQVGPASRSITVRGGLVFIRGRRDTPRGCQVPRASSASAPFDCPGTACGRPRTMTCREEHTCTREVHTLARHVHRPARPICVRARRVCRCVRRVTVRTRQVCVCVRRDAARAWQVCVHGRRDSSFSWPESMCGRRGYVVG
jgi:hypothetical protein